MTTTKRVSEVNRMRNRIVLVSLAVLGLTAALFALSACDLEEVIAEYSSANVEATEVVAATFTLDGLPTFDIDSSNGRVRITGVEGQTDVQVVATLSSRGETLEEATDRVSRILIHMEQDVDRIVLRYVASEQEADVRKYSGVSFDVTAPPLIAQFVADTSNGAIEARSVQGTFNLDTSNGHIIVESAMGDVIADTSNGRISIESFEGSLRLDTSNGEIEIHDVVASVDANTSNGRIDFSGTLAGPTHRLSTSNGRLTFRVSVDSSLNIEARTSNATISTTLPLVGDTIGDSWNAALNPPATIHVELRTSNGDIRIESRP